MSTATGNPDNSTAEFDTIEWVPPGTLIIGAHDVERKVISPDDIADVIAVATADHPAEAPSSHSDEPDGDVTDKVEEDAGEQSEQLAA